ncbi:3-isopropylmalate dehydrogenase [Lactococcus cremoris]|uniref:3-isopropylmalate dehydrogenase n=2 Tax=Lactococcus lactis subsp. cremoris TaxID=1359 RepID=A0A084ABD4_LACLC|nr:3-isopropylmalate dehydrogenase [Lactococcus cremoris]TRW52974.1 3-isopropylmalate dehydrogenase [Lactococcus lactis]KEY62613.1 3-isopropylmalate dehydrogenase [Lactococcus cremoris subsp. cremoris GE214]KKW72132.1 3-isopropylmalate dehydrogenase, leuB [Lactococcus cremoris]MCT0504236.1 3-isopropylmalate dehydrogenase [Lactococcus cremoris]MCT0504715.1 3-isopropylmalate dehydrogenase [Lactococcus cremoris]
MTKKIVTLAGDGIGPEIMSAGLRVLKAVSKKIAFEYELVAKDFGGIAIDKHGHPLPEETLQAVKNADAILLAAIGHPKYNDAKVRPEQGLLALRKELGLYANVRPLKIYPALKNLSPIRNVENVDFVVIRELTGGIYFGQHELSDEKARDINDYTADEIRRILHFAFKIAQNRPRKLLTSVDKQNVLATSKLWRKIADEIAVEYPDVTLEHQLVDSCAMLLITEPQKFDVIVTENLFGDILSDEASSLAGTLGVMPSSSHGFNGLSLYEPIHGSAPDIAGKGIANPVSMISSVAMMLRESFGQAEGATLIEKAVTQTFADGILTQDLGGNATTAEMTEAILKNCQ